MPPETAAASAPVLGAAPAARASAPRLAVRWRCAVERPAGEAIHAVALLRLAPPPEEPIPSTAPLVEVRRACRYGAPFDVSIDIPEEAWLDAIEDALIATIKTDDQATQRLHRDLDTAVAMVLDDPERYGRYHRALLDAVEAGRPQAEAAAAEVAEAIHRAFAVPWVGDAQSNVRIEYAVAPTAARAAPEAAPPAAALRPIPFAASLHGVEARELKPGMTIAPEKNRRRRYVVAGVVEGAEKGTVTVFCRALGADGETPPEGAGPDALFTVAEGVRVPFGGDPDAAGASADLFSNPAVFLSTAAVVLFALYLLVNWFLE
jgi:hypothetical protein